MIVVFPAPVCPTIATVSPGSIVKDTSRSTQSSSSAFALASPELFVDLAEFFSVKT